MGLKPRFPGGKSSFFAPSTIIRHEWSLSTASPDIYFSIRYLIKSLMQTQEAKNTCDNKPNENKTIGVLSLVKSFAPNIIFKDGLYSVLFKKM